ncbi:large subunit ribosomal protein L9 [Bacilli bacterium PM5-3]|nr:large subunit ribosomal protein L9 [Bacilli bacterium PM5-3]MDH6603379.1 large subunit ribosomal protein L9 [Bacilli bacterium PM5-9]
MKVILLEDVRGKGKKDDIIEVAGGFATHLIRNKQAIEASKGGVKKLDNQKAAREEENEKLKKEAMKNKEILERKPLEFKLNVGKDGRVFKSVSHKQIVDRVMSDFNIKLDKRKFKSKENINTLGTTNVDIELHKGVIATIKVAIKEQ